MKKVMAFAFPFLLLLVLHAPATAQDTTTTVINPPSATVTTPSKQRPGAERGDPSEVDPYPVGAVESTGGTPIAAAAATDQVVDYNDPKSFFDEGLIGMLEAAAVAVLALLGGFIPGLRTVGNKWVRSGVVIFVALVGLATFKTGALTEDFFTMLTATFLPNFGATNFIYAAIKNIIGPLLKLLKK